MPVTAVFLLHLLAAICFGLAAFGAEPARPSLVPAGLCLLAISFLPGLG